MFSLFKKDPLKEKLKRAKKCKRIEDKLFWKKNSEKMREDKRINDFLHNDICPKCGEAVKLKQTTDKTCTTDNHYKCTKCTFEKHIFCDDEDDE